MDLFKLVLSTGPIKNTLSKFLKNQIYLKTGYHIDLSIDNITIKNEGGKVMLHVNMDAAVPDEEAYELIDKFVN
jgi:predicted transglutaminase-like protease